HERIAKYGLTYFIIVYLIGQVLQASADGKRLFREPLLILSTNESSNAHEENVLKEIDNIARFVTTELKYFIDEHGGEAYDYKSTFKSQSDVVGIRNDVLKAFEKDIARDRANWFTLPDVQKGKVSVK